MCILVLCSLSVNAAWDDMNQEIAYWSFNDEITDIGGQGWHSNWTNSANGYTTGKLNNAIDFNNGEQLINASLQNMTSVMTIYFWIKPDSVGAWDRIIHAEDDAACDEGNKLLISFSDTAGNVRFEKVTAGGSSTPYLGADTMNPGSWYLFVVTANATGLGVFVNNTAYYANGDTSVFDSTNMYWWSLGAYCNGANNFDGQIDEFTILGETCDATCRDELWNSGAGQERPRTPPADTSEGAFINISVEGIEELGSYDDLDIQANVTINLTYDSTCYLYTNGTEENTSLVTAGKDQALEYIIGYDDATSGHVNISFYCQYNSSVNASTDGTIFNLTRYQFKTYNNWTQTPLTTFGMDVNGVGGYSTSSGVILLANRGSKLITFHQNDYINRSFVIDTTNGANITLYQSIVNISTRSLHANDSLTNFSIETGQGVFNCSPVNQQNIVFYPDLGTYYWNWSHALYWGQENIEFIINDESENLTLAGVYNTVFQFQNNITSEYVYPTCTYQNWSLTVPYRATTIGIENNTMNCSLFGYIERVEEFNSSSPINATYPLQPVQLILTFSENTSGYVAWQNPLNGSDGFEFNASQIIMVQEDVGLGYVSVVFNDGQQLFEYYNDGDTHVNQYLYVVDPDLIQPVKLWDGTQMIEGLISVYKLNGTQFQKIYSTYTDEQGYAEVLLQDGNTYKFVGSATGYNSGSQIEYIAPTTETTATTTILIEISEAEEGEEEFTYSSSCAALLQEEETCTITATSSISSYQFMFNYTMNNLTQTQTESETTSSTLILAVNNTADIEIYIDGEYKRSYRIVLEDKTQLENQIGVVSGDRSWIYDNTTVTIAVFIALLFGAALIGFFVEKKFSGWGNKAAVGYLLLCGFIIPVFYAIGLLFGAWFTYEHFKGLNK